MPSALQRRPESEALTPYDRFSIAPTVDRPASWVCVAIFALAGTLGGMLSGGVMQTVIGTCIGIMLGGLSGPRLTRIGYLAAACVAFYTCLEFYSIASLPNVRTAQVETIARSLPAGSSFDHVYRYLKRQHTGRLTLSSYIGHAPAGIRRRSSMIIADYDTRFLLSRSRFRTKFVFDTHERLYRWWVE